MVVGNQASVPLVTSPLLYDVDYSTYSTTIFRFETAGFDLYFLYKLKYYVLLNPAALDFGRIQALNQIGILRVARAINLETVVPSGILPRALQWLLPGTRRKRN